VKGNPAFDPSAPVRVGRPGRLLFRCQDPTDPSHVAELYASATDFEEGKQSFFLKQQNRTGGETLYPLHGYLLERGAAGIFMIHDGKGTKAEEGFHIDQTVNMGLVLLRTTSEGLRGFVDVLAEEAADRPHSAGTNEYRCEARNDTPATLPQSAHIRTTPGNPVTTPSFWYREADITVLRCTGAQSGGEYRFELLGSSKWPTHLGFLVVHAPGITEVGYTVHLLEGAGKLLIHVHGPPHQSAAEKLDTVTDNQTAVGGVLLTRTNEKTYEGWAGLAASSGDPYNTSFSKDATFADYASLGRAVIPPVSVSCK
jgi:hypothetical protein